MIENEISIYHNVEGNVFISRIIVIIVKNKEFHL